MDKTKIAWCIQTQKPGILNLFTVLFNQNITIEREPFNCVGHFSVISMMYNLKVVCVVSGSGSQL